MLQYNWRPISLRSTIYKIYADILARRLGSWAMDEEKNCKSQKGFLPFKGCLEHSFLLQSVFEGSKRRKKCQNRVAGSKECFWISSPPRDVGYDEASIFT